MFFRRVERKRDLFLNLFLVDIDLVIELRVKDWDMEMSTLGDDVVESINKLDLAIEGIVYEGNSKLGGMS